VEGSDDGYGSDGDVILIYGDDDDVNDDALKKLWCFY
jgi:glutamine synthetase adenylyltransferase